MSRPDSSGPVVWVIKEQMLRRMEGSAPMDYGPAMSYGDICFITQYDMPLYVSGKSSVQQAWERDVAHFCSKYDESRDFVVPTGQPAAIFAIGHALGRAGKTPRFLVWRREEGQYRVVNHDSDFMPLITV